MFSRPCSTADRRRLLTAATKTTTTTSFHRAATPTNTRQWHHTNDGIISKRRSSLSSRMNGLFVLSLLLVVVLASAPLVTGRPDILPDDALTVADANVGRTSSAGQQQQQQASFESCTNATSGEKGRCMFAMDCFRAGGRYIGICTKGFFFGSCCSTMTKPEDLGRIPVTGSSGAVIINAIDAMSEQMLDLSFWPQLLGEQIYDIQPPPVEPFFPLSDFHATTQKKTTLTSTTTTTTTTTSSPITSTTAAALPPVNQTTVGALLTTTTQPSTIQTNDTTATTTTIPKVINQTSSSMPTTESSLNQTSPSSNITIIYATAADHFVPLTEVDHLETDLEADEPTTLAAIPSKTVMSLVNLTLITSNVLKHRENSTTAVCGKPVYRWPKIVSGENARPGQWPWQISLQEKTRRGFFHKCGASLLNEQWVVTAAHCVINTPTDNLLVRIGGIDFANPDDKFYDTSVQTVIVHSKFNMQTQQYDIAMLKLQQPVSYQPNILPICLPDPGTEFDNDQSFVAGWGRLGEHSPTPTKLQYVGVPIINNTECERIYRPVNRYIDHLSICAGYPMGLKDSCEGDSGGPMMVFKRGRWVLAGIISWGVGCARPNQPGVSTRVTEFLDWIQSQMTATTTTTTMDAPAAS